MMWHQGHNFLVLDNFLDRNHFNLIRDIDLKPEDDESLNLCTYLNFDDMIVNTSLEKVNKDGPLEKCDVQNDNNVVQYVFKNYKKIIHYYDFLQQIQNKPCRDVKQIRWGIVNSGKNFDYPIHNDAEYKLLSIVVYLSEKNIGTILYNEDKSELEIEWAPNKAFIFARDETTYHSYKSNGLQTRKTLMINLLG